MAWLQSSFTSHQLLTESGGSNHRKGYKSGSNNKNSDPDKSDTPLLHDNTSLLSPESESSNTDWFENAGAAAPKKQTILQSITSKPSFLSSSFFDRSGIGSKPKAQTGPQDSSKNVSGSISKPKEDKKLLNEKQKPEFKVEEDYDDDSDDEWCIPPTSSGYQRVRSGAD